MPFGATPFWPWMKSKNPIPRIVTVADGYCGDVVTVYIASISERARDMKQSHGLPVAQV